MVKKLNQTNRNRNKETCTHTKETKTEPNKSNSKRTTKQKNPRMESNN